FPPRGEGLTPLRLSRFAHHCFRSLVVAQPLKRPVAQDAVVGPFGEPHLGDELGLHEPRPPLAGVVDERAVVAAAGAPPEERAEPLQVALFEPRTHLAGVAQLSAVVIADEDRPDAALAPPLAGRPAA